MSELSPSVIAATVIFPTRNRRETLRQVLQAALAQTVALEIIVLDDASTDGTDVMMKQEFASIRYERFEETQGPCRLRNLGTLLASASIVFPLDDDSILVSRRTIEQTLADFDDQRVGAVAIPFINIHHDQNIQQRAPSTDGVFIIDEYVGAAHALRKDLFLKLGGYREHFFYMMEEADLCLRMLQGGSFVRLGRADPIHHVTSESRNRKRALVSNAKNHILFGWHNVPMPYYPAYIAVTTVNLIRHGFNEGRVAWTIRGLWHGWIDTIRYWKERRPVSCRIYRLSRKLKRSPGRIKLDEFIPQSGS